MFRAHGRFAYRFRWPIIGAWVLVLLASVLFVTQFPTQLKGAGFTSPDMESEQALRAMDKELHLPPTTVTVVFTDDRLTVDDDAFRQGVENTATHLKELDKVLEVRTFYDTMDPKLVSADRHTTYVDVPLAVNPDDPGPILSQLRGRLQAGPPKAILSGDIVVYSDMEEVAHRDLVRAETFALPISLVVLLVIFGTLVSAGLPVAMGGISVAATLALLYLLARITDVSVFSMNVASMLGVGLGIDYSLLLVSRFREELARTGNVGRAVTTTVSTAGKTVFFSGISVLIGLCGLFFFPFMIFRSLAYGGLLVVMLSVIAALTLVPATLGVLGPRINALALRRIHNGTDGFWHRLATQVMRHPVIVFVFTLAIITVLAYPILGVRFGMPGAEALPTDTSSRQGVDLLNAQFGAGEMSPIIVVLQSENNVLSPENTGAGYDLTQRLLADPRVKRVQGLFNLDPRITREQYQMLYSNLSLAPDPAIKAAVAKMSSDHLTILTIATKDQPMSDGSKQLVKDIRAMAPGGDLRLQVTGLAAISIDMDNRMFADFPLAIAAVFAATFVALLVLFRSVLLPLKAALMSGLSILAACGILVFVFQEGHLSSLLGFTSQGFLDSFVPIMLFCVLFGLSMDYEVFLLTRIKEIHDRTGDNTESVAEGLAWTGRIITSAAAVMVVVTGAFAATDLLTIKSIGLGAAAAILLDATIVRALLVPALMRLLGQWNWWAPSFLKEKGPKVILD